MTSSQPLTPHEQLAYTDGQCALFVLAAHPLVGGVPTRLVAADPRHLETLGSPPDEPYDVHVFLHHADGTATDAEGRRPLALLLRDFGVRRGYAYRLETEAAVEAFGSPDPALVAALNRRLRELGWADGAPEPDRALHTAKGFRAARAAAQIWWPAWSSAAREPRSVQSGEASEGVERFSSPVLPCRPRM